MDKETRDFLENMQAEFKSGFERVETRLDKLETRLDKLETRLDKLETRLGQVETRLGQVETRLDKLETGQEELKAIIGELEAKNANRHLELQESIYQLQKDFSTVEVVTASNYEYIAKLKSVN